jgi:hypothetical protein
LTKDLKQSEEGILLEKDQEAMVPTFAYELLRDHLIPDLLGKNTNDILYWAGKHIARKFPLTGHEEIVSFFQEAGWGTLYLKQTGKTENTYLLSGKMVEKRMAIRSDANFKLETGFLSQQIEQQKQFLTEGIEEIRKRHTEVLFKIRWDEKDKL